MKCDCSNRQMKRSNIHGNIQGFLDWRTKGEWRTKSKANFSTKRQFGKHTQSSHWKTMKLLNSAQLCRQFFRSLKSDKHWRNKRVFLFFRDKQLDKCESKFKRRSRPTARNQFSVDDHSVLAVAITCTSYHQQYRTQSVSHTRAAGT